MTEYDRIKAVSEELKRIAMEHNVAILTAVQCPRPYSQSIGRSLRPLPGNVIFIDYVGLIK